jgi:hypothetical protein
VARILIGTGGGIHEIGSGDRYLSGRDVTSLAADGAAWWALLEGHEVIRGALSNPESIPLPEPSRGNCLLPTTDRVLVGTSQARLLQLERDALLPVDGFDGVEGRDRWYTPWGGPPDTRSIALDQDGTLYVNVHVGGIPVSSDGGRTFRPTIDIDADVHQVIAHRTRPGLAFAAGAQGLDASADGGQTWSLTDRGLHASYCRAVAIAGDTILLSASTGPRGGRAGVYRRRLEDRDGEFDRCAKGLPDWFEGNIDTHCLAGAGNVAALGTAEGRVFVSEDAGETWEERATDLPPVRCVVIEQG